MLTLVLTAALAAPQDPPQIPDLEAAATVAGLEFTADELKLMVAGARENVRAYAALRRHAIDNTVAPAFRFTPLPRRPLTRTPADATARTWKLPTATRPDDLDELGFAEIRTLAALIRQRDVSCRELTELFLGRLHAADAELLCVVTFMDERALERADALDAMLANGEWLGPLHGIPYGAKDLLSARGAPTTWGATPFKDQVLDVDAAVITHLEAAGAVLCAKLTLGALAWGDVWFGGMTRNPWNPKQGSSGSSAGSASATAAGALPFAIGSETLGSIVSPSTRCGCSSLRPTFGVVDTRGAMALSWTMDKLGPLCRSAADADLVFWAMTGQRLPGVVADPRKLRIGYDARGFARAKQDRVVLEELRQLGFEPTPIELPDYPVGDMMIILNSEAAAAFDELTRSDRDDELVRQIARAWPNEFRVARLIPAVEYIQAQRLRTLLMQDVQAAMADIDVLVHPSFGPALSITNLTGHPTFVAPFRLRDDGSPRSISFTGQPYEDTNLLALVELWQSATPYDESHPPTRK